MSDERAKAGEEQPAAKGGGFFGSLKDALVAASRDDQTAAKPGAQLPAVVAPAPSAVVASSDPKPAEPSPRQGSIPAPSAAEAAREVRASVERHVELEAPPTTRVFRAAKQAAEAPAKTRLVRGKAQVVRGEFQQDPVVGWLVVVGGPGVGSFRPVFEGNNTIGRAPSQRIPLDFGDDTISSEEQAYIRYDSAERSFLFVPNLAKTNVVSVNEKRPTAAVELAHMDVITIGRTQVVFVPFCGPDFDWAELAEAKD